DYEKYVIKKLNEKGFTNVSVERITDLSGEGDLEIFFSEGINNFNDIFKLELNKIATEFAVLNGINRLQLTRTLDIINENIIHTDNIVPFCSVSIFDKVIEIIRPTSE